MSREQPLPDRGVTLTRKGLIAAICAAAEPFDWTRKAGGEEPAMSTCPVTIYDAVPPSRHPNAPTVHARRCGEPVVRGGLCGRHADDRDRLGAVDGHYRMSARLETMSSDTTAVGPGGVAAPTRGLADRLDTTD